MIATNITIMPARLKRIIVVYDNYSWFVTTLINSITFSVTVLFSIYILLAVHPKARAFTCWHIGLYRVAYFYRFTLYELDTLNGIISKSHD